MCIRDRHIWSLIGTEANASWSTDKKGLALMAAGVNARAIDFAKIGKLVLNNGSWGEKPILEKEWIKKSTQENSIDRYSYCYHWYKSSIRNFDEEGIQDYYAAGIWGQIMYVSPASNTIIIRFGKSKGNFAEEIDGGTWNDRIIKFANYNFKIK